MFPLPGSFRRSRDCCSAVSWAPSTYPCGVEDGGFASDRVALGSFPAQLVVSSAVSTRAADAQGVTFLRIVMSIASGFFQLASSRGAAGE